MVMKRCTYLCHLMHERRQNMEILGWRKRVVRYGWC